MNVAQKYECSVLSYSCHCKCMCAQNRKCIAQNYIMHVIVTVTEYHSNRTSDKLTNKHLNSSSIVLFRTIFSQKFQSMCHYSDILPLYLRSVHILKPYITRIKPMCVSATGWFTARFPLCLWVLWLGSRATDAGIHFWQGLSLATGVSSIFHTFSLSVTPVDCKATC